jgi:transcriptional regulator of acetoin/glycerol metabolism
MESMKKEHIELNEKIMKGFRLALDRLYEKARKNGEELVVSDKEGNVIRIKP